MKIENVEAFLMSFPIPEEVRLPFWGGLRTIVKRDAMLIRIVTDTELVGYAPGPWSFFHQESPMETISVTGDHSI